MKKLYRSTRNRMIGGVCGGVGEYLDLDPTVVRVLYVVVAFFTVIFPAIILYIVLLFIMPNNNRGDYIDV